MNFEAVMRRFRMLLRSDFFLFSAAWTFGIIIGICLADAYAFSAGRVGSLLIGIKPLPIATLLITTVPVLIIAASLWRACPAVSFSAIVFNAVCRGFCGYEVFLSFGRAAWLVRGLLLFSGIGTSVLIWWLLFRSKGTDRHRFKKDIVICVLSAIIISAVDIMVISPFLRELAVYI